MNKITAVSITAGLSLVFATTAFAQQYPTNYSGACVDITSNLSYNSRGAQVSELQNFLVSQNFPGGGSWMVTGYFGGATEQAVKDFQQEVGLPMSGIADASTRAAIEQMTCGGANVVPPAYTAYPTTPTTPYTYPGYPYTNYTNLDITMLSQNTGFAGQTVTIYGTGFDPSNNTVNFGNQTISGLSSNSTSITFTIPSYYAFTGYNYSGTTVNLSVSDSRGTSNVLSFTLYGGGSTCANNYLYAYGSCGCNNYSYPYALNNLYNTNNCTTNSNPGNTNAPTVSYLTPTSGPVGTSVTIFGSGFTTSNNTVHFGNGIIVGLTSSDGQSLSFTVPSQLTGYGNQNTALGTYPISVTNGNGYSTSALSFNVTGLTGNGSLSIASVSAPTTLGVNQTGTWTIVLNNPNSNTVTVTPTWGDATVYPYNGTVAPQTTYAQGQTTLTFTHVYSQSGTYTITFTAENGNGAQAYASATVTVAGSGINNEVPTISYLNPNSGYIGQQVTIYGTNFVGTDTVNFGNGAIQSASNNGNSLTFVVPSSVSPYCTSGSVCPEYLQQITPGTYNVSVMNQWGTSNELPFTVQ